MEFTKSQNEQYLQLKSKFEALVKAQKELDECNESCDIITQSWFGKEEPEHVKESYAKFRLRAIALREEIMDIIMCQ